MSARFKFFEFGRTHDDVALDIIRSFLGIALFIRGVLFIADGSRILELVRAEDASYLLPALAIQATAAAHLLGGLMLSTGLLTRIGALLQIPVMLGAVYFVTIDGGLFMPNQSLELTVLVLFLLVVLFTFGSGKLSLDNVLFGTAVPPIPHPHRETSPEYRAQVTQWQEERLASIPVDVPPRAATPADPHADANVWRGKMVLKYGGIATGAAVVLVVILRMVSFEVSMAEIGAVAGALFMILAFFFLFFGWALRD